MSIKGFWGSQIVKHWVRRVRNASNALFSITVIFLLYDYQWENVFLSRVYVAIVQKMEFSRKPLLLAESWCNIKKGSRRIRRRKKRERKTYVACGSYTINGSKYVTAKKFRGPDWRLSNTFWYWRVSLEIFNFFTILKLRDQKICELWKGRSDCTSSKCAKGLWSFDAKKHTTGALKAVDQIILCNSETSTHRFWRSEFAK